MVSSCGSCEVTGREVHAHASFEVNFYRGFPNMPQVWLSTYLKAKIVAKEELRVDGIS